MFINKFLLFSQALALNACGVKQDADEISQFLDFTTDGELVYVADFGNR